MDARAPDPPLAAGPPGEASGIGEPIRWIALAIAVAILLVVPPTAPAQWAVLGIALLALFVGLLPSGREAVAWPRPLGLLVAAGGAAMLIGLHIAANPWFGVLETEWPWEVFVSKRAWSLRVDVVLTVLLSIVAIVVGLRRPRKAWPWVGLLALGLFLAARGYAENSAFRLVRQDRMTFAWAAGAAVVGGALLHLGSASRSRRGVARGLLVAGVATIVSVYLAHFEAQGGTPVSSVSRFAEDYARTFEGLILGRERDAAVRVKLAERAWSYLAPFTLQAASLLLALVVALLPTRRTGRGAQYLARLAWIGLLATWILPSKAAFYFRAQAATARLGEQAADVMLRSGVTTWLIVGGALAALLRVPAAGVAAGWPRGAPRARAPRWGYAIGAFLILAMAVRAFHPGTGTVLPAGVLALFQPLEWNPPTAYLVILVLLLGGALLSCALPAGPGRAGLAATVAFVAFAALTPQSARSYGLEVYVPMILLAIAAGGVWAGGRAGPAGSRAARLTAGAAGALLLILTVYPLPVQVAAGGFRTPFANAWTELLMPAPQPAFVPEIVVLTAPWKLRLFVDTVVGVLALLFAFRGRPSLWRFALGAALLEATYLILWPGLVDTDGLETSILRWGEAIGREEIPQFLLLLNAVRDAHTLPGDSPALRGSYVPSGTLAAGVT